MGMEGCTEKGVLFLDWFIKYLYYNITVLIIQQLWKGKKKKKEYMNIE